MIPAVVAIEQMRVRSEPERAAPRRHQRQSQLVVLRRHLDAPAVAFAELPLNIAGLSAVDCSQVDDEAAHVVDRQLRSEEHVVWSGHELECRHQPHDDDGRGGERGKPAEPSE